MTYNLTYDAENRLTSVSGGATATFVYDGDGNRVKGTVGGSRVAMRVGASRRYYLLSDHLGGTNVTVTTAGEAICCQ